MKALKIFLFSLILLAGISCKKSTDYIAHTVDITVLNQQGQNLLAPPFPVYSKDNIELFYVVNGQAKPYTSLFNHGSKGFLFIPDLNLHQIRIDLNTDRKGKYPITLVKFGNTKIDTIKAKYKFTENSTELQTVWFNGVQQNSNIFTIVK